MADNTYYPDRSHAIGSQHNNHRATGSCCVTDPYQRLESVTALSYSFSRRKARAPTQHPHQMLRRTPCVSQPQAERNSTPPRTIIDWNCQRVDGSLSEPYCVATSHATDGRIHAT